MFGFVQPRTQDQLRLPRSLLSKLQLFESKPELINAGKYSIKSDVAPDIVDLFFGRVGGDMTAVVTPENAEQLRALCDELEFSGFDDEIRSVLGSDRKTQKDLMGLRGRIDRHDLLLEELQRRVLELERQLREQPKVPENVEAVERHLKRRLERHLDHRVKETERAVREEIQRLDPTGRVSEVASAVAELQREMSGRASAEAVQALSDQIARLKRQEQPLAVPSAEIVARNEFVYDQAAPFRGIIAHLTEKYGANVHEEKAVEVTASSVLSDVFLGKSKFAPKHAVELGSDSEFCTKDKQGSWICYDFKGRRVTPTSYTIRSHDSRSRPRSWVLEVSNDGRSWELVDRRENNSDLMGRGFVTHNFSISPVPGGRFRFVRLRMTGQNHNGGNCLDLTTLEVFGSLSD